MSQVETNGPDGEPDSGLAGLSGLLNSVISAGRDILARRRQNALEAPSSDLLAKSKELIHHRGEASGLALACEVVADYQTLDDANRHLFFEALADDFSADTDAVLSAAESRYDSSRWTTVKTTFGHLGSRCQLGAMCRYEDDLLAMSNRLCVQCLLTHQ